MARLVGLVLHHQRALAHQRGADDAADRRTDRRVIEIELGARDFGLAAADLGLGLALGADGLFVLGLGRRALAGQRRDAPRMLAGQIERGHRLVPARPRSPAVPPRTACGSIRYSGSPAFTSVPCWNRRSTTMPETRGANVGNPGRRDPAGQFAHDGAGLRLDGEGADFGLGRLAAAASRPSAHCSQPIAAPSQPTSKTMHADRVRSPDIEGIAPVQVEARIEHSRRCRERHLSLMNTG